MAAAPTGRRPAPCLLELLIRAWRPWISSIHLVVARPFKQLDQVLSGLSLPVRVHLQPRPTGTVNALLQVRPELPGRALVLLGDCLLRGRLSGPPDPFPGIVVWSNATRQSSRYNYAVGLRAGRVRSVAEKPARVPRNWLCGTGVYFVDSDLLAAFAEFSAMTPRACVDISHGLSYALRKGLTLRAARLEGQYVNINTPSDLADARAMLAPS